MVPEVKHFYPDMKSIRGLKFSQQTSIWFSFSKILSQSPNVTQASAIYRSKNFTGPLKSVITTNSHSQENQNAYTVNSIRLCLVFRLSSATK